jgi:hypothetical protein
VAGKFAGRKLSDLADGELDYFLRVDAQSQSKAPVAQPWPALAPRCPDLSQYWFAKFELERRKPEAQRQSAVSLEISTGDTQEGIALKLAEYGYRAASRKYHPDHGGDTVIMQRLNAARQLVRSRLKISP